MELGGAGLDGLVRCLPGYAVLGGAVSLRTAVRRRVVLRGKEIPLRPPHVCCGHTPCCVVTLTIGGRLFAGRLKACRMMVYLVEAKAYQNSPSGKRSACRVYDRVEY